ncbi:LamG-like jellyroll fold domain-containing protein [Streptomyces sp. NPDC059810]|uniref:LamG-like jellyroll fold domain-containing protein n=1 Tax=Streptomyces sp. NPDC059810 TaxID=3346956 RepID=UPI00365E0A05
MRRSNTLAGILVLPLLAFLATLLPAAPAAASGTDFLGADPATGKPGDQILFRSGTAGYGCFRIPTLVRTDAGTLLAFAEARTSPSCADRGAIDIVVRRSTNEGRTWGPIRVVLSGSAADPLAPYTRGNPTPVVDRLNDKVLLLSTAEPATPGGTGPRREAIVQTSDDDGLSFSAPRSTNRLLPYPAPTGTAAPLKGWFGTGPAHGIQLTSGPHPGRLVVGVYQGPDEDEQHAGVLYSDDHGQTWKPGSSENSFAAGVMKPGEAAVAELPDGRVYVGARNELPGSHRAYAITGPDGISTPAFKSLPVTTSNTQGSLLTLEHTYDKVAGDTLLMAAPSSATDRADLRLYAWNTGTTPPDPTTGDRRPDWRPVGAIVKPGKSGYSDLAELTGGEIGLVYESGNLPGMSGGTDWSAATVNFRRIDPRPLFSYAHEGVPAPGTTRSAGPTTPDASPQANDAYFTGDAKLTTGGAVGQGLALDGNGDSAEVPYAQSLDPADGDFTYSLRFKHDATAPDSGPAVLLQAHGQGTGKPGILIQTDAKSDRVTAQVQAKDGGATVSVPLTGLGDSSDKKWHVLTLVRTRGDIALHVDGHSAASQGAPVSGSVTRPVTVENTGIRIGAGTDDGYAPFRGTIDEVRLHRAALTPDEIGTADQHLRLWLPFHVVDRADPVSLRDVAISDDVSGACVEATGARREGCVDGTILGGVGDNTRLGDAAVDKGSLKIDAAHPGVETPFRPGVDVGSDAFTYALWFKHDSTQTSANQVLLWAYGVDPDGAATKHWAPSLWARAEPSKNRIRAWAETAPGKGVEQIIEAPAGFGDGAWHLLTLIRSADGFRLGVDRRLTEPLPLTGTFTFPAGSGTAPDGTELAGTTPLGMRVGSKPGASGAEDPLSGAIDDVRLYGKALNQQDLDAMLPEVIPGQPKPARVFPSDRPRFRWSMEPGNVQQHSVMRPAATGRATPDSSAHANNASVEGGTGRPDGRFGRAFRANGSAGKDGRVVLPYTDSEGLGDGDFTVATVFSHDPEASATQSIVWAFGHGASERQLRIRTEWRTEQVDGVAVTKRKLVAFTQTDTGSTEIAVDAPGAGWHHVAMTREGGDAKLYLDGVEVYETDAEGARKPKPITGSLTSPDAFAVQGFLLGDSPVGGQPLKGSLDEFRVYRTALNGSEIAALWTTNTSPAQAAPVVHLPLDVIATGEYARM